MFNNPNPNQSKDSSLQDLNQGKKYPFQPANDSKKLSGFKSPVEDILADTEKNTITNLDSSPATVPPIPLKETPQVPTMERPALKPMERPIVTNNKPENNFIQRQPQKNSQAPFVIILVLIILILGATGFFAYQYFNKKSQSNKSNTAPNQNLQNLLNDLKKASPEASATTNTEKDNNSSTQINTFKDSDNDGLTDDKEIELGTNPNAPDTDNDGLTDLQEIEIYHSNPTLKDTDGDGYNDGAEVQNGYDPILPGNAKLIK